MLGEYEGVRIGSTLFSSAWHGAVCLGRYWEVPEKMEALLGLPALHEWVSQVNMWAQQRGLFPSLALGSL